MMERLLAMKDASQERLEAKMDSHHEKLMLIMKAGKRKIEPMMEACLEKTEATDLEANPEEIESESGHQEVLKDCWSTGGAIWGLTSICMAPLRAEEEYPG
jgi:hypothetical protein